MKHADVSSSEKEAYQRNTPQAIAKVYSRPCAPMRCSLRGRDAPLARSDAGIRAWTEKMKAPKLMKRCHRVKLRHAALQQ
jgi:hypothetical protein